MRYYFTEVPSFVLIYHTCFLVTFGGPLPSTVSYSPAASSEWFEPALGGQDYSMRGWRYSEPAMVGF